jgi:hypothetical protein
MMAVWHGPRRTVFLTGRGNAVSIVYQRDGVRFLAVGGVCWKELRRRRGRIRGGIVMVSGVIQGREKLEGSSSGTYFFERDDGDCPGIGDISRKDP